MQPILTQVLGIEIPSAFLSVGAGGPAYQGLYLSLQLVGCVEREP